MTTFEYRLAKFGYKNYGEYLESESWKSKSNHIRTQRGGICQVCKSSSELAVHHASYARVCQELDSDLFLLCREHHKLVHLLNKAGVELFSATMSVIQGIYDARTADILNRVKADQLRRLPKRKKKHRKFNPFRQLSFHEWVRRFVTEPVEVLNPEYSPLLELGIVRESFAALYNESRKPSKAQARYYKGLIGTNANKLIQFLQKGIIKLG